MQLRPRFSYIALLAFFVASAISSAASAQVGPPQDRYIVVLKEDGGFPEDVAADVALRTNGRVGYVYEVALRGFSITMPRAARAAVARNPRVAYVEEDRPVSIVAQTLTTGVDRIYQPAVSDPPATTGSNIDLDLSIDGVDDWRVNVDVAVLDTGIDSDHPDLNVVGGANCLQTTGGGPPWARNYYCDPSASYDDDHYHGTHVAGTIGAIDNDFGVVGVAPGARLYAVKVLDSGGSGYTSGILAGIDWVVAQGNIEVINLSLGGSGVNTSYETAIDNAVANGVVVVVAAGNSDIDANNYSPAFVPSAITVSALADFDGHEGGLGSPTCRTDQDDTLADFSNWGSAIDIAGPGVCILSTYPIEKGSYGTISGTSMAAPHVAGAAALSASGTPSPQNASDVQAIRNALISAGNTNWTDDSGDGVQEPLLDISSGFVPVMIATGGGGGESGGNSAPTASFTYEACVAGQPCQFTDTSTDDGTITWEWNFGDGTTSTSQNPTHSYTSDGNYDVMLTVTDDGDLFDSATQEVSVLSGGGGGGGCDVSPTSQNNGSTWTAIIMAQGCASDTLVEGEWDDNNSAGSCTTSADGSCSVERSSIRKRTGSVTFNLSSPANQSITVFKP